MRRYLSFGGGLNSVALYLLLRDQGVEFEAVYADHGGDWPHVYEYLRMLQERGYPITVLPTRMDGLILYDRCIKYGILPSRWRRWCTAEYKVKPLRGYYQDFCTVYLGFAADEAWRAKPTGRFDIVHEFPLIDEWVSREGCAEIISAHGLPVPGKSTCWFCPFQNKDDFRRLKVEHPDLFGQVVEMERVAIDRRAAQGKTPIYLRDMPVEEYIVSDQPDEKGGVRACLCEDAFDSEVEAKPDVASLQRNGGAT